VRCDDDRVEALQVMRPQWSWRQEMGGYETYDAGDTDGLCTRGYFGPCSMAGTSISGPKHDGQDRHGKVLRVRHPGKFAAPRNWAATMPELLGPGDRGYYGAVFDGRHAVFRAAARRFGPPQPRVAL